ncbi:MAG: L-lactate permease [Rubrobacter sp.]|nr:L-lactate permease [Rubrobacter sp.]
MVEIVDFAVAASPFLVAGFLLIGLGWSALRAGMAAFAAAVLGAVFWLDASGLGGAFFAGIGTSWSVLYVLFGGLLLYNLLSAAGAVDAVSRFLGAVEPEKERLALGVVVGAAPFFESVTGFGVAVVISAPILLAAGFSSIKSAVLATWGQCAVPWGALGVGTVIGADLSGTTFAELSDSSAFLNVPLFVVYAVASIILAGGWTAVEKHGVEAVLLGLAAGFGTLATSLYFVPELSGAVGGLLAALTFLALRWRRVKEVRVPGKALFPYAVLVALITLGSGPERIGATLDALDDAIAPFFTGPGLPLILSAMFAAALFGLGGETIKLSALSTVRQWLPTAGSVLAFVLAGQIVASSGAAAILASAAFAAGGFYPVAASFLGALGGILTGSNAASNALFMPPQIEAARSLGVSGELVAAVQNVSGSHASMLAPQRIILAATATGLLGREGEIVRKALPPVIVSVAVVGALGLFLA